MTKQKFYELVESFITDYKPEKELWQNIRKAYKNHNSFDKSVNLIKSLNPDWKNRDEYKICYDIFKRLFEISWKTPDRTDESFYVWCITILLKIMRLAVCYRYDSRFNANKNAQSDWFLLAAYQLSSETKRTATQNEIQNNNQ